MKFRALFGFFARLTIASLCLATGIAVGASSVFADMPGGKRGFEAMTQNMYFGASTDPVLSLDPAEPDYVSRLVTAVTGVYYEIVASQPNPRAKAVAASIAARMPDIVALQEAAVVRIQSPGDLATGGEEPAKTIVFDQIRAVLDELASRGAHYRVAVAVDEFDVELPMLNFENGTFDDVRLTDREAILVRTDLPPGQFRVANPQTGHFTKLIPLPALNKNLLRGWSSVDVFTRGETFRFICVHLEEETAPQLQVLQAEELLAGPAASKMPVVIAGDFNADPLHRDGSVAFDTFRAAGFTDTWTALNPKDATGGLTWGHDELLAYPTVAFDRRIDLVLFRGRSLAPESVGVTDVTLGRSEPPLWASDHAGLAVEFGFRR